MDSDFQDLVTTYNEAVEGFNLARLEYAMEHDGGSLPPIAQPMPSTGLEHADKHRPATLSVQAVRDFFEGIFDGAIVADTASPPYKRLHGAALDLTRRFFQVSLARMGISCEGMLD
jgi:hypothetical protein